MTESDQPTTQRGSTVFEGDYLRDVLASVPAFVLHVDDQMCIRFINRLQPGYTLDSVLGRSVFDFVDPRHHDIHRQAITRARETLEPQSHVLAGDGPDGSRAYYESRAVPIRAADGTVGVTLIAMDITEHVKRAEALAASEEKLRVAVEASGIGLWTWDAETKQVEWTRGMHELTGREDAVPPDVWVEQVVHPEDQPMMSWAGAPIPDGGHRRAEHRIVRPDGEVRYVLSHSTSIVGEDGKVARRTGGSMDLTGTHELREQLRTAQKLDAVGSLTAGVAHNLNNLLSVIVPALELLQEDAPARNTELLADALHAGRRSAELVEQLMTFAGQSRAERPAPLRMDELMLLAVAMCRRAFERDVEIQDSSQGQVSVVGVHGRLEQVFMNLLINARDAIREAGRGGTILVRTERVVEAPRPGADPAPWVCVTISDDGVGMTADTESRVFEPFFTTKEVGRGTGLGLATSYAIVKEHGGWIACETALGEGTTFRVFLPAADVEAPPSRPASEDSARRRRERGHVLVVDDEVTVRRVAAVMLEQVGVRVTIATSADECIELLRSGVRPGLILLDRSMPGRTGFDALSDIRAHSGDASVVFFTGQDVPPTERDRVEGVLSKPLTRDKLQTVLAQWLPG